MKLAALQLNGHTAFVGAAAVGLAAASVVLRRQLGCPVFCDSKVSVELTNDSKAFDGFVKWLGTQDDIHILRDVEIEINAAQEEEGNTESKLTILPSSGKSYFTFRGQKVEFFCTRTLMNWGGFSRSLRLTTQGSDRKFLEDILEEAKEFAERRPLNSLVIYKSNSEGEWNQFGCARRLRPISTVFLDKGIAESLLKDLKEFLNSKEWYEDRGVPYRRGYLFYGPPGCGKTSMVKALASELDYAISVLSLSNKKMTDDILMQLMSVVPNKSFVLLEDVDAIFKNREKTEETNDDESCGACDDDNDTKNKVTFSGLLNTIDGIVSSDGRILFMTTNYLSKLDPALIRPGRVDKRQLFDYPTEYQMRMVFTRFYPDADSSVVDDFVNELKRSTKKRSVAEIQGHFMLFKHDPKKAITTLNNIDLNSVI